MSLASWVRAESSAAGVAVYSPEREREVIAHVAGENRGPLSAEALRRLYERIIDESRSLERQAKEK